MSKVVDKIIKELDEAVTNLFGVVSESQSEKLVDLLRGLAELKKATNFEVVPTKPVCPTCGKNLKAIDYRGYYDTFKFWECETCEPETIDEVQRGAYR